MFIYKQQYRIKVNHKRIYRINERAGGKINNKKSKATKGRDWAGKVVDNILNRDFNSGSPLEKLCMDITEIKCIISL